MVLLGQASRQGCSREIRHSDFPAWLSLKAGSSAWLLEASGELFIGASNVLGLSWPASPSMVCYQPKWLTSPGSYVSHYYFSS